MEALDTNVIVRHLTQDNPTQSGQAHSLFAEIESGTRDIYLTEGVLVETVQVLSSKSLYNLPRSEICEALSRLIDLAGLALLNRYAYHRAIDLYLSHGALSFVDCLCIAHAERLSARGILSFDRGFDRASVHADTTVRRVEPSSA